MGVSGSVSVLIIINRGNMMLTLLGERFIIIFELLFVGKIVRDVE